MCFSCAGKSNPNNGRKTMGQPLKTVKKASMRTTGPSPFGQPKVKMSFGRNR